MDGVKLDRETDALLSWVASRKATPMPALSLQAARQEYRRTLSKTEIDPPGIGPVLEHVVGGPGGALPLRIYNPIDRCDRAPGLLFIHGGGCVVGDLDTHDTFCRTLCADVGAVVVAVDYRLAPEHPFPAAVEDGMAALSWLSLNAGSLGIDRERIAIAGDSAGGGIAAVSVHETRGRLAAPLKAQVLIYPALDLKARLPSRRTFSEIFPIPADLIDWFHNQYFGEAWPRTDPRAFPLLYPDYGDLPPALIVTAGHDPLLDEAIEYADVLAAGGTDVDYWCAEGTIHGFMNMGRVLRTAYRSGRARIAQYLTERLRPLPVSADAARR
ncbi:MAG: alpha/beta hydrolase [Hyphomicrobiaceae bacterium]